MQHRELNGLTIFMSFSGQGGVERMMVNLMRGLINKNISVHLILAKSNGDFVKKIPKEVKITRLPGAHTLTNVLSLGRLLKTQQPNLLLVAKHRAGMAALLAKKIFNLKCKIVLRIGTTVSAALEKKGFLRKRWWYATMRSAYARIDKIIAVSEGVANDIKSITGLTDHRVCVINNPVISDELLNLSEQPVKHHWLNQKEVPVIMGMGRLTYQKDFVTLIQAFASVNKHIHCRLVILGEGDQRNILQQLVHDLNLESNIEFLGFKKNPYQYLSKASLFVLSSRWEGSPNVLTEAMALGIPVVATDCPSGPREVLQSGSFGKLCPVEDVDEMRKAIIETLQSPPTPQKTQSAVTSYSIANSTASYLKIMNQVLN